MPQPNLRPALLLCAATLMALSASAENLIRNASFEERKPDSMPVIWKANKKETAQGVTHKLDDADAINGRYSGFIANTDPGNGTETHLAWIQDIDCSKLTDYPAGTEMLLSFDFNADAPGTAIRAYVEGRAVGQGFSFMGPVASRYVGWGKYQLRFKMPQEKPDMMYVVLQLLTTGNVRFDNVTLDKAPPAPVAETAVAPRAADSPEPCHLLVDYPDMPPQNLYDLPGRPARLRVQSAMGRQKFRELAIRLCDDGGRELAAWKLRASGNRIDGEITLPELGAGNYALESSVEILGKPYTDRTLFRITDGRGTEPVRFRADNIMLLHGKPFFPIAVCPPFLTDEALAAYQRAGFNTITPQLHASGNRAMAEHLYRHAEKYQLNVIEWINLADNSALSDAELTALIRSTAENAARYRNFIGILNDEDAFRGIPLEAEKRVYELFRRHAPGYLLWVNQAPRGTQELLRRFARYSDVTGADVYPVPDSVRHSEMPNRTISCIGDYTDDFVEIVDGKKPVWMILQAWSWGGPQGSVDKPFPTATELRFMFYNAILHGATGIAWFDNNTLDPQNPVFPQLAEINLEFASLSDFFTEGRPGAFATVTGDTARVDLQQRELGQEKLLILANESAQNASVTLDLPAGTRFFRSPAGSAVTAPDNRLRLTLTPFAVCILSTRSTPVAVPASFGKLANRAPVPVKSAVRNGTFDPVAWRAEWVWDTAQMENKGYAVVTAVQEFDVTPPVKSAYLAISADNASILSVNGRELGRGSAFNMAQSYDIAPFLKPGKNRLEIRITNFGSYGGVLYEGEVDDARGVTELLSGERTLFYDAKGAPSGKPYRFGPPPVAPWQEIKLAPIAP